MKSSSYQFKNPGIVPWLFIIIATLVLTSLGAWQVKRLYWKEGMLASIEAGQHEPALTKLPESAVGLKALKYKRVQMIGTLNRSIHILRIGIQRDLGNGFYVLSPFTVPISGGKKPLYVLANRGFVSGTKTEVEEKLADEQATNPTMLKGILRPAYAPRLFSPDNHPDKNIWSSEDMAAIEKEINRVVQENLKDAEYSPITLAPLVIEVTEEQAAEYDPIPHPNNGEIRLRNDHLGYAVTWFLLALTGVIMFGFYCRKKV